MPPTNRMQVVECVAPAARRSRPATTRFSARRHRALGAAAHARATCAHPAGLSTCSSSGQNAWSNTSATLAAEWTPSPAIACCLYSGGGGGGGRRRDGSRTQRACTPSPPPQHTLSLTHQCQHTPGSGGSNSTTPALSTPSGRVHNTAFARSGAARPATCTSTPPPCPPGGRRTRVTAAPSCTSRSGASGRS